jgi:UDP-glucose 4-epimerase
MENKITVKVIGAAGFIGGAISDLLTIRGMQVKRIDRGVCDLLTESASDKLARLIDDGDTVVFAAAKAPAKQEEDIILNLQMTTNVLKALENKRIPYFLNISSDAIYADTLEKINENSLTAPLNSHGIMHLAKESAINSFFSKAKIGHLRPTLVFGSGDPHNGYGPNSFLRSAKNEQMIKLFGEGEELRDHIHIDDVAKLGVAMIEQQFSGAVNAVSGRLISFYQIAELFKKEFEKEIEIIRMPRRGPMPHNGYRGFEIFQSRTLVSCSQFTSLEKFMKAELQIAKI